MKHFFLSLLACGVALTASAQTDKIAVGVMPFTDASQKVGNDLVAINDAVTNALVKSNRFIIVDRSKMQALMQEKNLQKTEDFIDGKAVEQGKSLGAEYLVSGNVNSYTNDGTQAKFTFTLSVMEVATSKMLNSEQIESKGGSIGGGMLMGLAASAASGGEPVSNTGNPEAVFKKALNDVAKDIDRFIAKNFPLTLSIAEMQTKDKNGAPLTLLISGGSSTGVKKGDKFRVVEMAELEVDGKKMTRKKEIGQLQVLKVEDENFSSCKVLVGGTDIAMKSQAGAKLKVITLSE